MAEPRRSILVAVRSFAPSIDSKLRVAEDFARALQGDVVLLHVVRRSERGAAARAYLDTLAARLHSAGVHASQTGSCAPPRVRWCWCSPPPTTRSNRSWTASARRLNGPVRWCGVRHGFEPWKLRASSVVWIVPASWRLPAAVNRLISYPPQINREGSLLVKD